MKENYIVFNIETTGPNPWYSSRITCICARDGDNNNFSKVSEYESEIIEHFFMWLISRPPSKYSVITKNGKGFDIPFILSRLAMIGELDAISFNLLNYEHFDLHEITKKWVSLDDMARLLGCKQKSGNGINAIKLWKEKRYNELKKYCMDVVLVTEQVWFKHMLLI